MSDSYELAKCMQPQDVSDTPYESKVYNFISDINSGVYSNNAQSLVQFNLSDIYTATQFVDMSQIYLTLPMVYTACYSSGNAPVAPTANAGNEWLITPKSGSWNLIQSMEVQINGVSVIQQTPQVGLHTNFKMLSQMSKDDLRTLGRTLGMQPDDVQSYLYNGTASATSATTGAVCGNGLCNNMLMSIGANGAVTVPNKDQQNVVGTYSALGAVYNTALQYRSQRIANNLTTPANGITGQLLSAQNFANEYRPCFAILNANYMTWYDIAIVRLCDICDFFNKAPLTKNLNGMLRLYINTGAMGISLSKAQAGAMYLSGANSSFSNTCPFTINQMPVANIPATVTNLVVSCNIARSTVSTSIMGVQLSLSQGASPMSTCRCYYPMIKLKPAVALKYLSENSSKNIVFTNVLSNIFQSIPLGTFNTLVQSGVRNIRGILMIPYVAQSVNGKIVSMPDATPFTPAITPFSPISSPFDTAPCTTPLSLTQLNVSVGGLPIFPTYINYTFENFLENVTLYDKINATDMGLSCGLFSQFAWENGMRYYYVDCSRGSLADNNTPRNVTVTFNNNNLVPIDLYVFIEYYQTNSINCESGIISN